jgi:4-hydroxybenzoyl-CoA thioesterase
MAQTFTREKLIRFHHCDPAGIVFYPQYFVLFNELVEDWFDEGLGIDWMRLLGVHRRGVPMRRLECDFLSPSRIGERIRFTLSVRKLGTTAITIAVAGEADGAVRIRAQMVVVYVTLDTQRPVPIDGELRERIKRYLA